MSLNRFMHPRNIYKKPPNFKELAIKYPEFRECVKVELTGKVKLDFKKPEALRALTCSLLKKDFGLDVEIPLDRLIPTLPLRLNYLLWIEDLLKVVDTGSTRGLDSLRGIDIGTGASCIYSLLGAKKNKWHMLATDVDPEINTVAQRNVDKNELADFIKVKLVEGDHLLTGVLEPGVQYDFCMCNPPFFSSEEELDPIAKSRSPSRHPPHNAPTGNVRELVVEGGEVAFVSRLLAESKELGSAVRVYTTKVGQKSSLLQLLAELRKVGVACSAYTEFCQGNTTRWGLAWTFLPGLDLRSAPSMKSGPRKKQQLPMSFPVPRHVVADEDDYCLDGVTDRVIELLDELEITYKLLSAKKHMKTYQMCAATNTWSHQRRKRREKLRQKIEEMKMDQDSENDYSKAQTNERTSDRTQNDNIFIINNEENGKPSSSSEHLSEDSRDSPRNINDASLGSESEVSQDGVSSSTSGKRSRDSEEESGYEEEEEGGHCSKRARTSSSSEPQETSDNCVLKATLIIRSLASNIHVEIMWLDGTGGKDAVHQVLQYLKNKLK